MMSRCIISPVSCISPPSFVSIGDRRSHGANHQRIYSRIASTSQNNAACTQLEQEILRKLSSLSSNPIYPADSADEALHKEEIDLLVEELEGSSTDSLSSPLALESRDRLVGTWSLVYANSGTVVTKSLLGTAIKSLDALPYVGLERVEQQLENVDQGTNCNFPLYFPF